MGLHAPAPADSTAPKKAIILIGSLAGYSGAELSTEYTVAKWGIRGLLRGARKQLASLNVRLNLVAPFFVDTPLTAHLVPTFKEMGVALAALAQVTEAVARLATDESAWGRSVVVMPEGLMDAGDDTRGAQGGKVLTAEGMGEQWRVFIDGAMSDEVGS